MTTKTRHPTIGSLLERCDIADGCWLWNGDMKTLPVLPNGADVRRYVGALFFGGRRNGGWTSTCGTRRCIRPTHLVRGRSKDALLVLLKQADDPFAESATWTDEDWHISRDDNPVWNGKLRCAMCDDLLSNHPSVFGTCFHQALILTADDPAPVTSLAAKRIANSLQRFGRT